MKIKNVFVVSLMAMLAVPAANAVIVSQENIVGANGVTVNVPTSGDNKGKVVVTGPNLPTVNNATLTIQKNGTTVDTFTANASSDKTINITVPTSAADVSAVPTTRKVNGNALSSDVTLTGSSVDVATGYAPAETAAAVAAGDSLDVAIGKLEKQISGKQVAGNYVPTSRTVNGKALSSNITLSASDVSAVAATQTTKGGILTTNANSGAVEVSSTIAPSKIATDASNRFVSDTEKSTWNGKQAALGGSSHKGQVVTTSASDGSVTYTDIDTTSGGTADSAKLITSGAVNAGLAGKVPTSRTVNGKALSSNITLSAADVSAVPTTRTVNGKALSSNITLSASDVSAVATAQGSDNKDKVMITNNTDGTVTSTKFVHYSSDNGSNVYNSSATDKDTTIPSVRVVEAIANTAAGYYVPLDQGSNTNKVMITNGSGEVVAGTITNQHVASGAAIEQSKISGLTTALSNAQNKIPSGSENSTTLASIWVE